MSEKLECPGCGGYSSSVLADFQNGEPCRFCQLPNEAAVAIFAARQRSADAELTHKFEEAITRAIKSEQASRRALGVLAEMRELLDQFEKGQP